MSQGLFHRQSICRGKPILDFVQRTPREYMKHTEIKPLLANISGICFPRLKAVHQDYRVIFTHKKVYLNLQNQHPLRPCLSHFNSIT